ncbi:Six-hairpin glycosidase-like protein [Xylaria flabelliformis]|nr:Six-hairpin glycosidase-like protein [Xylaria flabelliformis]
MAVSLSSIIIFLGLAFTVLGRHQLISRQGTTDVAGTSFLDHEGPISGFNGQTFLRDNIPYIDIPDKLIEGVYYYRWTSLQRNIRYVTPGTGYMCTEFVHPVGYAKAFGSIDAAAGHQIDESRWLRNTVFGDDYIQLYTRGPADPLQYTQWILDSASRRAMVTGDSEYFSTQLDDMIRVWHLWDPFFDSNAGLYYIEPVWDAQELSLPGFIADPNNTNPQLRNDGPDTFRPSHNAYMVANARAIARAAGLVHDGLTQSQFLKTADDLEAAMFNRLWAPEQEFFMDVIRPNNPDLTRLTGREQVGLFPFRFGIGLNESYAQPSIDSMFDPQGFFTPYGPTTLEVRNEWFAATKPTSCWWNGMSWPYSTGHTLKSLAAIFRSGVTNVTAEQYHQYLNIYAATQQKNGMPYVAESHAPYENAWSQDSYNHSEHYDHSTNNDDVITGLLGIIPQPDDTLQISPIVPNNRWTNYQSPNQNDTLTVYFARPRNISSVTLALYSDITRGGSVDLPSRIDIIGSNGLITSLNSTSQLLPNDKNTITFDAAETTFVAVNLYRRASNVWVGVCELEVWTPPVAGPTYFAVDAHLTGTNTKVVFDTVSKATSNGAVVGGVTSDSAVAFSGINAVSVSVAVNQVGQTTLQLQPTGGKYVTVSADVTLAVGKNYVTLNGGSDTATVRYETLTIS